ncbi:pyridoxamine 5'-phosphate oxidase family protein [Falsigemmobacter faecalis]|uniref:Pyridoxamine 5'-phosphate oxidase family protein n=1 Tax=Falsigemmobacter faecalis TaxID=2488730 RepID=A0A3P3DGU1_9RHOB|nr:pyridoxamine 5'-phosphate oxidase family protein [Falsigemmobacter faecalis]RRH73475.1 pyridoxamine 5'-phosphate oxidase family protein [Falsigemmobacter faecalis]
MSAEADHVVLCWLATADATGQPNVSPKEIFLRTTPDEVLIADIASPRSVANIRQNPKVCVSMIDIFRQRGEKLEGTASLIAPNEPEFAALNARLERLTQGLFIIHHVIRVRVGPVSPIRAPGWHLFPDKTEADMRREALATYRVTALP